MRSLPKLAPLISLLAALCLMQPNLRAEDGLESRQRKLIELDGQIERARDAANGESIGENPLLQALEEERADAERRFRSEMERVLESNRTYAREAEDALERVNSSVLFFLGLLAGAFVLATTGVVFLQVRQQLTHQRQYQSTVEAIASLRGGSQLADGPSPLAVSPPEAIPERLSLLHKRCLEFSREIDEVTRRDNASQRVAELVYGISRARGFGQEEATVHYLASLVYDIGFLNVEPAILASNKISEDEFETLKSHTTLGEIMMFFAEREHRPLFREAALKHHENLDGSGYPAGLRGNQIPYIARVIRVAETYVALVSKREYRKALDKDEALGELIRGGNHYDQEIVLALGSLI